MIDDRNTPNSAGENNLVPVDSPLAASPCYGNYIGWARIPMGDCSAGSVQVIPPPGKSLRFLSTDINPSLALHVEPSCRDGHYHMALVSWGQESDEVFSHAEGPRCPVPRDEVWQVCQRYGAEHLVKRGVRLEMNSDAQRFNRWLYQGDQLHKVHDDLDP